MKILSFFKKPTEEIEPIYPKLDSIVDHESAKRIIAQLVRSCGFDEEAKYRYSRKLWAKYEFYRGLSLEGLREIRTNLAKKYVSWTGEQKLVTLLINGKINVRKPD